MDADLAAQAARFVLQLGVVLVAAKLGAEILERWLHQPAVLGELAAGVLIGPYALGGLSLPAIGPLFPPVTAPDFPIPMPLWVFAEMGAVVLLFVTGLETDFGSLLRFGPRAAAVAIAGVVLPFALGAAATVAAGLADGLLSPEALFVGAALTATSVGVTARVLGDIGKLDTPEAVTILGAAVFDDVVGILVVALIVPLAAGASVSAADLALTGLGVIAAWIVLTGALVVAAPRIAGFVSGFRSAGAPLALALGLAFLCAFIAQDLGLAMIVGAFSAGIALSRSQLRDALAEQTRAVYSFTVPVFFVVVGMLVDLPALVPVLAFAVVLTALAIAGKLLGCGVVALGLGFRPIGALRIGVGMIPRGEVALVIAGIALASGWMDQGLFAVVVFMTFATTMLAPVLLAPSFRRGGAGFGAPIPAAGGVAAVIELPSGLAERFERHLLEAFSERGFALVGEWSDSEAAWGRELRRGEELVSMRTVAGAHDHRRVEIESETTVDDWATIVAAASSKATAEATAAFRQVTASTTGQPPPAG
ncbi:MAG: sodium/hydrogen exchanger [Chloroflexi bacterium]|nr:sodium/hydrogen exchanger [Chloroflexota bacterium]